MFKFQFKKFRQKLNISGYLGWCCTMKMQFAYASRNFSRVKRLLKVFFIIYLGVLTLLGYFLESEFGIEKQFNSDLMNWN